MKYLKDIIAAVIRPVSFFDDDIHRSAAEEADIPLAAADPAVQHTVAEHFGSGSIFIPVDALELEARTLV